MEVDKYSFLKKNKNLIILSFVVILIFDFGVNVSRAFEKPSLIMNIEYYKKVLEENTEDGAKIITDPALSLSASEGRKIISVSTLIWERWRNLYSYEEIFSTLDPDYIILTERKKKWGEQNHPQTVAYKKLLKINFIETKTISHEKYGKLWIYKRIRNNPTISAQPDSNVTISKKSGNI